MREMIEFVIAQGLQVTTIVVLIFTWRAALKQAWAAEQLTKATDQQIKMTADQANAAPEQVEVARRQIAESLRPILVARLGSYGAATPNRFVSIKNEGTGTALNVWWAYGKPTTRPLVAHSESMVGVGILAPWMEHSIAADEGQRSASGISIVYRSFSGVMSVTHIERESSESKNIYYSEVDKDFKKLDDAVIPAGEESRG
jgi:hypothetical protein